MKSKTRKCSGNMRKPLPTTIFITGHGFYSRLGPKNEDWEVVPFREDDNMNDYEISVLRRRSGRRKS